MMRSLTDPESVEKEDAARDRAKMKAEDARYRADDPCWRLPNTLEIRLRGRELAVNGFPARSAVGLWKRPRTHGGD